MRKVFLFLLINPFLIHAQDSQVKVEGSLSSELCPGRYYSISSSAFIQSKSSQKVPAIFAAKTLAAFEGGAELPEVVVYEKDSSRQLDRNKFWDDFSSELAIKGITGERAESLKKKVVLVPQDGETWQRDHSVFTIGSDQSITAHSFQGQESYLRSSMEKISSIKHQKVLPYKLAEGKNENGNAGGNVLGMPGGLCLMGNNIDLSAVSNFCPKENIVQIETHWLFTGHVDEFIKFVPDLSDESAPPECRFKILANSPAKAFELLEKNPQSLFRTPILKGHEREIEVDNIFREACMLMSMSEKEGIFRRRRSKGNALQVFLRQLLPWQFAYAQRNNDGSYVLKKDRETKKIMKACLAQEEKLTNKNVLAAIRENQEITLSNRIIEETINKNLSIILKAISARLPHCDLKDKIIPVPQIYGPSETFQVGEEIKLSDPGMTTGIFPNFTNSVTAGRSLIISDPRTPVFQDYVNKQLSALGLKTDYIDTFMFSDLGNGNIHCATSSAHACR